MHLQLHGLGGITDRNEALVVPLGGFSGCFLHGQVEMPRRVLPTQGMDGSMKISVALSLDPGYFIHLVNNIFFLLKFGKVGNFSLNKLRLYSSTLAFPPLESDGFEVVPRIYETHLRENGIRVFNLH